MKLNHSALGVSVVLIALTLLTIPARAVPQEVRDACWIAAERVTPILTQPEKEQYVANCIADATAGTPPPSPGNTDRNRY
jgi:hypothetical protein